ncbi:MAG TPA: putative quinol monooxygenase [Bradyrhizobium sp.]|uniref:putative quinol monooxygenase n=1 Tax=Bradyrhizobium sp. TaxID=376 RepID=UPI002D7F4105|nr:putative quinol monooxygenase [Bradyrhizobium sp.]HET7886217.1 putative quinol monooxygenase [Bradyrhizobium sp.]
MLKSISMAAAMLTISTVGVLLPAAGQRAQAQSAGMFVNAVDLDIVPAERDSFLAAIKENGAAAAQEPGCKRFDIVNLNSDPNHFFLYEVYDNEAAFKAHRETDHFKKYMATTGKMVAKREARQMSVVAGNAK